MKVRNFFEEHEKRNHWIRTINSKIDVRHWIMSWSWIKKESKLIFSRASYYNFKILHYMITKINISISKSTKHGTWSTKKKLDYHYFLQKYKKTITWETILTTPKNPPALGSLSLLIYHLNIYISEKKPKIKCHMDISLGPLSGTPIPAAKSASSWVCGAGPIICFTLQYTKVIFNEISSQKVLRCAVVQVLDFSNLNLQWIKVASVQNSWAGKSDLWKNTAFTSWVVWIS